MPDVDFPANGGSASGYLAVPESGGGPATVVLQEWWGLDDSIKRVCDRFAEAGFLALAPDLYRGEATTEPDEAQRLMMNLAMEETAKHMSGAVDYLAGHEGFQGSGVGSMGFCLGGGLSIWTASVNSNVGAAVSYYGVFPHGKPDFSKIDAPVLGHFGTADEFVSADDARALEQELRDAGVDAKFHYYEGKGHAFANDHNRLGTYDEQVADESWERTTQFLREHLT